MTEPAPPRFPAMRYSLLLFAGVGVALCAVSAMLGGLGRWAQLPPAASSAAVCLAGAILALEPVRRASQASLARLPLSALAGMGLRLGVSALGLLALVALTPMPARTLALWTLGWYLLLLLAEVTLLVRYLRQRPVPPATTTDPAEN